MSMFLPTGKTKTEGNVDRYSFKLLRNGASNPCFDWVFSCPPLLTQSSEKNSQTYTTFAIDDKVLNNSMYNKKMGIAIKTVLVAILGNGGGKNIDKQEFLHKNRDGTLWVNIDAFPFQLMFINDRGKEN